MTEFVVYGYDSTYHCVDEAKFKTLKAAREWESEFLNENKFGACNIYRHSKNGTKRVA